MHSNPIFEEKHTTEIFMFVLVLIAGIIPSDIYYA